MKTDTPAASQHSTVVDAANQLLPLLAELDQQQNRYTEYQRKAHKIIERTLILARQQSRSWSDSRQIEIDRLDANSNSLQLKIGATMRNMQRLRRQFEAALTKFRSAFVQHDVQLANLQIGTGRIYRQNAALDRCLRYLIRHMSHKLLPDPDEDAFEVPEDSHPYIAIGLVYFTEMLIRMDSLLTLDAAYTHPTLRYRPVSFLEVGSGSGRNMMIVKGSETLLCDRILGFDINPDQIAEGEELFGLQGALEVADAMTYDYGGHDVIFSYRPFSDLTMQRKLEEVIVNSMSPSAYLVAPLAYDLSLYPNMTPVDSQGDIWQKTG